MAQKKYLGLKEILIVNPLGSSPSAWVLFGYIYIYIYTTRGLVKGIGSNMNLNCGVKETSWIRILELPSPSIRTMMNDDLMTLGAES